jgi:hypothetical protein
MIENSWLKNCDDGGVRDLEGEGGRFYGLSWLVLVGRVGSGVGRMIL